MLWRPSQGVTVVLSTIVEHNGFDQRGPLQIVDVIERRLGSNQHSRNLGVTKMRLVHNAHRGHRKSNWSFPTDAENKRDRLTCGDERPLGEIAGRFSD